MYTVPVLIFNQQKSVEESKYEEKRESTIIVPDKSISKKEPRKYQKRKQCAYNFFLVHLPYYINKEIRIHEFYCLWNQNLVIWVMDMCQNISSDISKNLSWKFIIKVECTSAVIF